MKIGITTHAIDGALTGIGNYVYNLVKELDSLSNHEYTLIHFKKNNNFLYDMMDELLIPNVPIIPNAVKSSIYLSFRKDFDIVHETGNIGLIFPSPFKRVLTIHDLRSYLYPEAVPFWRKVKMKITGHIYDYNSIDKIITVSQSVKNDAIKLLGIQEEKIEVIYQGMDHNKFKKVKDKERLFENLKEKYCINSRFILTVTTLQPLKNIPTLIKAYYNLKKKCNLKHKLVIVGGKGWKYSSTFNLVRKLNLEGDIIFTGYVDNKDLILLYNAADLFVFPSIYEGFGLPPLEAMACGTPVVTSNTSSLPEVVGDAGIMFDPYDVNGLSDVIYELLRNEGLRQDMIKKGLERAKMFSWRKTAEKTLKVYEEVISMG